MVSKTTKRKRRQPSWLNKKEMAGSIGISVQAFGNWGLQPVAKIGRETFYTVDNVIDYCLARELKKIGEHNNVAGQDFEEQLSKPELSLSARLDILKVIKVELENHRLELQNAVLEGRSLPAWAVTEVLSKILSRAGEIFDGLALKVKRKHPKLDVRVIELIKAETIKAMNEVASVEEYIDELIENVVNEAEDRIR